MPSGSINPSRPSGTSDRSVTIFTIFGEYYFFEQICRDYVRSVAFSADGQLLASGSDDKTIRLWDLALGSCKCTLEGHR